MLDRVAIGIKTFLRDEKLFKSLSDIRRTMPEVKIIVADCGEQNEEKDLIYADLIRDGHRVIILDFDAGFGSMSNAIVEALDRPMLLISSDDFDHSPASVKMGIEKMLAVLDTNPELDLVGGRVNNRPYEFFLSIENGVIMEIEPEKELREKFEYYDVDLTVNYTMIRRKVFWTEGWVTGVDGLYWQEKRTQIGWDDGPARIGGGEHGAFFVDLKGAGFKVGYVPGVNVNQQAGQDSERYRQYRNRARNSERPCFEKRGVKKYILANGIVDYEEK